VQLAFRVAPGEMAQCAAVLKERGVHFVEGPTDQPFGHRTLFFRDPDGNVLEIYAEIWASSCSGGEPLRHSTMMVRAWRFVTLVLAALALSPTSAHVLELPQKMQYDAQLYSAVNTTMYLYFAIVGGVYSMGAIVAAVVLTVLVRRRRSAFRWTAAGAALYVLWFISWLTLVVPVNRAIGAAMQTAPAGVPALYMTLRPRWEYGHAVGFGLELLGFCALVVSVLVDTPATASEGAGPRR